MRVALADSNELWSLEAPTIPKPSRLFHLEPMGVGTPYVESLTSYITRLAEAHSVPPGNLLAMEIKPILKKNQAINLSNSPSIGTVYAQGSVRALNGTQLGALQLVEALEVLTLRTDLRFLTMLPWAEVIPVLGLLKYVQTWCPWCYRKWRLAQQVIYSPLLWTLKAVQVCPEHHQLLESQCPYCHQQFLPLWRNSRAGFCLRCGQWLGASSESCSPELNRAEHSGKPQREIWVANTLGELIARAPQFQYSPPRETIKKAFSAYVEYYTHGNVSAFGRWLGIKRHEILHWHSGVSIPQLDNLLKVCFQLSTTLSNFLELKLEFTDEQQLPTLCPKPRKKTTHVNQRLPRERFEVLQAMQLALVEYPPPSLTELALRLGFKNYSSLSACSKPLSAAISARYADYRRQVRQERICSVLVSVLHTDECPPPSLRQVAKRTHISEATFYRYFPELCQAISIRYKDYQKFLHQQAIELGCLEVRRLAPELHAQGITPSVKHLSQIMAHPATLWHQEVLAVLSEVRRLLDQ